MGGAPRLKTIAFGTSNAGLKLIAVRRSSTFGTAIEVWDVETGTLQHATPTPPPITCELIRAPHHRLVWTVRDGTVVFDMRDYSGSRLSSRGYRAAALTPDGSSLITTLVHRSEGGEQLFAWDLPPFLTARARSPTREETPFPFHGPQARLGRR